MSTTDSPPLAEPTTLLALERVVARRNASYLASTKDLPTPKNLENILIRPAHVLRELQRVADGEPAGQFGIRDFLGGIGLIVRRGFDDTVAPAGLKLLKAKARAAAAARRAAA